MLKVGFLPLTNPSDTKAQMNDEPSYICTGTPKADGVPVAEGQHPTVELLVEEWSRYPGHGVPSKTCPGRSAPFSCIRSLCVMVSSPAPRQPRDVSFTPSPPWHTGVYSFPAGVSSVAASLWD